MKRGIIIVGAMVVGWALALAALSHISEPGGKNLLVRMVQNRRLTATPGGSPSIRQPALAPLPRRYVEKLRPDVERLNADPAYLALPLDQKRVKLTELFLLKAADADFLSLSEEAQRRVTEAFLRACLPPS